MAGALTSCSLPVFRPLNRRPKTAKRFRVFAEIQESVKEAEKQTSSVSPLEDFKPPDPKPFSVRPDKRGDVFGASLPLFFRFGSGVFAQGKGAFSPSQVWMCKSSSLDRERHSIEEERLQRNDKRCEDTSTKEHECWFLLLMYPKIRNNHTDSSLTKDTLELYSRIRRYSVSFVPEDQFPAGQYAMSMSGNKLKETAKLGPRPEKPIEIYEYEGCPFCRKVREIVAVLDLDVLFYPCPRNGPNFRPKVLQMGGKQQFPYMVDPNTGVAMYESDDIIKYLVNKYGDGSVPILLSLGLFTTITAGLAMTGRLGKGSSYTPSKLPPEPIELWAYEGSPFCKLVREVIVELELPHILHSCARGSPKRQILFERVGHFQAPYLEDPNTGVKMFESADIIEYLKATYALQQA